MDVNLEAFRNQPSGPLVSGQSSECWLWLRTTLFFPDTTSHPGLSDPACVYVCVLLRRHHYQSCTHKHRDVFRWGWRWAVSPGCRRLSADFRCRADDLNGNVFESDLPEPPESVCRIWQDTLISAVHTLLPWLYALMCGCVCLSQSCLSFPPVRPAVPGMFHPSQRCFQDAHPEQQLLLDGHSLIPNKATQMGYNRYVIRKSIILAFCWHHLTRSGVTKQVCISYNESFVCMWGWQRTKCCLMFFPHYLHYVHTLSI